MGQVGVAGLGSVPVPTEAAVEEGEVAWWGRPVKRLRVAQEVREAKVVAVRQGQGEQAGLASRGPMCWRRVKS